MKIRRVRNPNFEDESLKQISWTRVVRDKVPQGRQAACCGKNIKSEEIVVSFPLIPKGGTWQASIFVHKKCLVQFLTEVPDEYTIVQQRIDKIKDSFIRS